MTELENDELLQTTNQVAKGETCRGNNLMVIFIRRFVRVGNHMESDERWFRISLEILLIILDSFISLHLIATDKLYKKSLIYLFKCLLLEQLQLLLRKDKQIIKNGFSGCKNSFYVKNFRLL